MALTDYALHASELFCPAINNAPKVRFEWRKIDMQPPFDLSTPENVFQSLGSLAPADESSQLLSFATGREQSPTY